jgi:dihydroneopterin aldolase
MDIIFIEALRLEARVGIYPREQAMPQTVELNLEIGIPPALTLEDDIRGTVDYAALTGRLRVALTSRHFNLLESLAEAVAELILTEFPALWVRVSIAKLGALKEAKRVGVRVERVRDGGDPRTSFH